MLELNLLLFFIIIFVNSFIFAMGFLYILDKYNLF